MSNVEAKDTEIKKALVCTSIEKVLLGMGKPVLDEVTCRLYQEYNCYLPDCYDNPEYLKKILRGMYGAAHQHIVKLINHDLKEFNQQKPIEKFLQAIV